MVCIFDLMKENILVSHFYASGFVDMIQMLTVQRALEYSICLFLGLMYVVCFLLLDAQNAELLMFLNRSDPCMKNRIALHCKTREILIRRSLRLAISLSSLKMHVRPVYNKVK